MPVDLWDKIIDEIKAVSPAPILLPFWRGESCLHPHFARCMQYAFDAGLRIHLSTNGHFMEQSHIDLFNQCEFLTFSIHTGTGFKNACRFVQTHKTGSVTTQVSMVDCEKSSRSFLHQLLQDSNLGGFDSIRLYIEHSKDGQFGYSGRQIEQGRLFCPKLENTLVISFNGHISRCNHIWITEAGPNIAQTTIQHAWTSETMETIRSRYPDSLCEPCEQWLGHTQGEAWTKGPTGIEHTIYG